ncbi:MAG: phosphohistidine phosphatase SixA [Ignavibacteriales bacterium]|nr:phosphohistidine phosphatase SixA [Ignavibacteriales bacterium]MBI3788446.1 phosphohistidine phosphatase SixA [Ignavibacteriales bacterium]
MIVYIVRHGDAAESITVHDSERPLSDLGKRQAIAAGKFLHPLPQRPSTILCSPLLRAVQTAETIQQELGAHPPRVSELLTPSSDPRQILEELNKLRDDAILLVGHEPHVSTTISLLISGNEQAKIEMKKGSLACIEVGRPIGKGVGALRWLVTSKQMM